MANRENHNSDTYLPSEDYSLLTPKERKMWLKLTPNMKHVMLKGINSNEPANMFNKNKNTSYKTPKNSSCNTKPFTKANMHEFLS